MDSKKLLKLKKTADKIRQLTISTIANFGQGHVGGSISITEVLTALYFECANIDPKDPEWEDRDRIVLSKGHAGPGLYSALAVRGYFKESLLKTLNQNGTTLPSHCDMTKTKGVDMTAGSLGQGLSAAVGMAIAGKVDRKKYNVYCIVGDGESQEGQIWEALMYAGSHKLNNLIVFIDNNKMQIDGPTDEINKVEPFDKKLKAFNFKTVRVDGHNIEEIVEAVDEAKVRSNKPTAIILDTVKAKGMPEVEGTPGSHSVKFNDELKAKYLIK